MVWCFGSGCVWFGRIIKHRLGKAGRTVISVKAEHLPSDDAITEVYAAHRLEREISPNAAATVASWWQAPGGIGYVLGGFASGADVDRYKLLDDIAKTRTHEGYYDGTMSNADKLALDMLATFVINYEEEEE